MRRADQITGILTLIFSVVLMEASRRMPPSRTFGPGAGFLPFWLGALMALLAILLIVQASRRPAASNPRAVFPEGRALATIGAAVAGLAGYILLFERLGFLVATGLFTAFLLGVVQRAGWLTTVLVAVLNALGLYVIFRSLLGVSLPTNVLGF